jgi:CDP-diacylglycerol--glycerol-3-phosphate 3-phosphatidyltransferase
MNIPNLITLSRIFLLIPIIYFLYQSSLSFQWWAVGLFLIASLTDWLDGYLARKLNQITELGKFLDPLTDKILVIAPLLIFIEQQKLPAWAVLIIIVREIAIAGWRVNPELAQQNQISGANIWGKLKTVTQITAIAFFMLPLSSIWQTIGLIIFWLAVILTVVSGLIYVFPLKKS